jgi:AraC family transcriptional regulator of adaptative response / DNA-3-methyladenine glycosylase II
MLAAFGRANASDISVRKQLVRAARPAYACGVEENFGFDTRVLDRARASRDARFDGKFFIAVTSTRIYCRPVCKVRDAKRSNIRYYPTAAAAAEAGFRPCLRCRPEAAPGTPAWLGTLGVVRRGLRLIEDGILDERSVEEMADRLGIGARHLHRLFVQHVGASPIAVAQTRRLHFAKRLLDETRLPITSIAMAAGFGSIRRFNDVFRKTYRRPPREIRKLRAAEVPEADKDEVVLRLAYRPPYDWKQIRNFLAARAIPRIEVAHAEGYARTVATPEGAWAIVQVRHVEGEHALELRVTCANATSLLQLSSVARRVFDLASDPATIDLAFADDPVLAPLVSRRPGLRIPGVWDPFECAVRAIVGQQVSLPAGLTLVGRLVERAGRPIATPVAGLTHLFPTPSAVLAADLSGLGLTGGRIDALRGLATTIVEGALNFSGAAEDVVRQLTSIRGIGVWTAQYVALRALGEPDAFPSADLVLRRVAADTDKALSASALEKRSDAWRPWRAYAAIHLWAAAHDRAQKRKRVTATRTARRPQTDRPRTRPVAVASLRG